MCMSNQYTTKNPKNAKRKAVLWRIRSDYDDMLEERERVLYGSKMTIDGMPTDKKISKNVEMRAIKMAEIDLFINAVDDALLTLPEEYRVGVWRYVHDGEPWPVIAARSTWERWLRRYLDDVIWRLA